MQEVVITMQTGSKQFAITIDGEPVESKNVILRADPFVYANPYEYEVINGVEYPAYRWGHVLWSLDVDGETIWSTTVQPLRTETPEYVRLSWGVQQ
jgi:hypothetical protein